MCPAGNYCDGDGSVTGTCSQSYFCPAGSFNSTSADCNSGHFCPTGSPNNYECPPGTYNLEQRRNDCTGCDAGFFCPDAAIDSLADTSTYGCPKGFYCPGADNSVTAQITAVNPIACPKGTFNKNNQTKGEFECSFCPPGLFCGYSGISAALDEETTDKTDFECGHGYFCTTSSEQISPFVDLGEGAFGGSCPTGSECPVGTSNPADHECAPGSYNPTENMEFCVPCKPGFACTTSGISDEASMSPCQSGYYCQEGSNSVTPLSTDNFQSFIDDSIYTFGACPGNYICPERTANPERCADSTYSTAPNSATCSNCNGQQYCFQSSLNLTTLIEEATVGVQECLKGYFCESGSGYELSACPPSTFSNVESLSAQSSCQACPEGSYCENYALQSVTGACDVGFDCPQNQILPDLLVNSCPPGSFCSAGTIEPEVCLDTTYRNATGGGVATDCFDCPEGWVCTGIGQLAPVKECDEGFYCENGLAMSCDGIDGTNAGKFCPEKATKQSTQLLCSPGTYSDDAGAQTCQKCPAGEFCDGGTSVRTDCEPGFYCDSGVFQPIPCPPGTYSNFTTTGLSSDSACTPCPPGSFCPGSGESTSPAPTEAGFFAISGAKQAKPILDGTENYGPCLPGFYCGSGSIDQLPCDDGFYSAFISIVHPKAKSVLIILTIFQK